MRYSHAELSTLFPLIYARSSPDDINVSSYHRREGDAVTVGTETVCSPVWMRFAADDTTLRVRRPGSPAKARHPKHFETVLPWSGGSTTRAGALASAGLWSTRRVLAPKSVSVDAPAFDPLPLADALAFAGRLAGGSNLRLDARTLSVRLHGTARLAAFDPPLPVGEDVLAVAPAAAHWFAGAVRLFMAREGRVMGRVENRGTRTVPLWRFRVDAPSGAAVVLDVTTAAEHDATPDHPAIFAHYATTARAFASVRVPSWPKRLTGSDLRDVVVDEDGLRLADPSRTGEKARPVAVDATSGDGTVCVPVDALTTALRDAGEAAVLFVGQPTDPLVVASRDGRVRTAILPWIPTALWAH